MMRLSKLIIAAGIVVAIVAVIAFIFAVFTVGLDWTGFNGGYSQITTTSTSHGTTTATAKPPGKTLWDWLQFLIIPLVLTVGGIWLNQVQKSREEKTTEQRAEIDRRAAEQRAQTDRDIALDNQREAALQAYINRMSELLLHEYLDESSGHPQVESIARARTVTVLRILDPARRASLIRFLSQAGILTKCIEDELKKMDLRRANLCRVNLSNIYLREAKLNRADLSRANLSGANLSGANLSEADLSEANLDEADLSEADLSEADLSEADLIHTNLRGAKITQEQWEKARSLKGTTMPDGSKHP